MTVSKISKKFQKSISVNTAPSHIQNVRIAFSDEKTSLSSDLPNFRFIFSSQIAIKIYNHTNIFDGRLENTKNRSFFLFR